MNRMLGSVATGLCAVPLLSLAGFAITAVFLPTGGGGSDGAIARGYLGLAGGFTVALAGSILLCWIALRFVPEDLALYLLVTDLALLGAGVVAWRGILVADPTLEYATGRAVLQIEVRIPRAILGTESVDAVASIDFAGGTDLSVPHPERARDDGDAVILPWETTPIRVRAWEIRVFVRDEPVLFALPLPRVPIGSAEWSNWIGPLAKQASTGSAGVSLRYRFQVIPYGQ